MGGFTCWLIALGLAAAVALAGFYVVKVGAGLAIKRDREQHLRIVNEARRRTGKPPMTDADLPPEKPPERDELLENLFGWMRRDDQRGFSVGAPKESDEGEQVAPARTAAKIPERKSQRAAALPVLPVLPVEDEKPSVLSDPVVVLLESRQRPMDQAKLKACVERAWGVEITGDAAATEWVVYAGEEAPGLISCGGYQFMFQSRGQSYFEDAKKSAAGIKELRTRQAVANCGAWRSIGTMPTSAGPGASALDRATAYTLLGKLAAELAGNTTLGVYLPVEERFFPYDETTLKALMSDDPLGELQRAYIAWVPTMEDTDAELLAAIGHAKARFGEFEEAFASRAITGSGKKSPFLVKAAFRDGDATEHMWVEVAEVQGGIISGFLRSSPVELNNLVKDEEVTVAVQDISDWIATMNGKPLGNFTGPIIERRHAGEGA